MLCRSFGFRGGSQFLIKTLFFVFFITIFSLFLVGKICLKFFSFVQPNLRSSALPFEQRVVVKSAYKTMIKFSSPENTNQIDGNIAHEREKRNPKPTQLEISLEQVKFVCLLLN
jgi:hypothetical protein